MRASYPGVRPAWVTPLVLIYLREYARMHYPYPYPEHYEAALRQDVRANR